MDDLFHMYSTSPLVNHGINCHATPAKSVLTTKVLQLLEQGCHFRILLSLLYRAIQLRRLRLLLPTNLHLPNVSTIARMS